MLNSWHFYETQENSLLFKLFEIVPSPLLLLLQPALRLLHVLGDRVLSEKLHALPDIEPLRVLQELVLETLLGWQVRSSRSISRIDF